MPRKEIRPPWFDFESLPSWYDNGACQGIGPELFFRADLEALAKRFCSTCPVRNQCRKWAVGAGSALVGVWGGTSADDRRQLRKRGAA